MFIKSTVICFITQNSIQKKKEKEKSAFNRAIPIMNTSLNVNWWKQVVSVNVKQNEQWAVSSEQMNKWMKNKTKIFSINWINGGVKNEWIPLIVGSTSWQPNENNTKNSSKTYEEKKLAN